MKLSLSPCPFCGSSADFSYSYPPLTKERAEYLNKCCSDSRYSEGQLTDGCWVSCDDCNATVGYLGQRGSQEMDTGAFDSFEDAADAWNKRI